MSEAEFPILKRGPVFLVAIFAVLLWLANLYFGVSWDNVTRGTFGDMFGAVNSIFSGLAFVGVTYAIVLQQHEVSLAKNEMRNTKIILDKQQDQLLLQNTQSNKQSLENTFFQLLQLLMDITSRLELEGPTASGTKVFKGKDVFPLFLTKMYNIHWNPHQPRTGDENYMGGYEAAYKEHSSVFGHYFRILFNTIRFIDESELDNKNFYVKILRAQLTDSEATVIFYNGLSLNGKEKLKPLLEKYNFLKNIDEEKIYNKDLKHRYMYTAFS
jgi:hypothetical protein